MMNILEQIFSKHLIGIISYIYQSVSTDLIRNKSRTIDSVPSLSCWLECYRHSKLIFNFTILSMLETTDNASKFQEQFALSLIPAKQRQELIENTIREIRTYSDEERNKFNSEVADYISEMEKESDRLFTETYTDVSRDDARTFISRSEIQFCFRVIIPCLVLYGKFPSQLLRKARLGDEKTMKQLAQVDHSIIHDKKIAQYIHNLSFRNPTSHRLLIRALVRDHPRPKKKDLKVDAAALIYLLNKMFCQALKTKKMTVPQIRQLFVDEANLHGQTDDNDLPTGETLYKRLKLNTQWDNLIKYPDKK